MLNDLPCFTHRDSWQGGQIGLRRGIQVNARVVCGRLAVQTLLDAGSDIIHCLLGVCRSHPGLGKSLFRSLFGVSPSPGQPAPAGAGPRGEGCCRRPQRPTQRLLILPKGAVSSCTFIFFLLLNCLQS